MILHMSATDKNYKSKTSDNLARCVSTYEDNCMKLKFKSILQNDYSNVKNFVTYQFPLPTVFFKVYLKMRKTGLWHRFLLYLLC